MAIITVIIPVYNNEKKLKKCLESLDKQTLPKEDIHVIVVDNDSTDNTQKIAKSFGVELLIQQKMKSPYPSRNMGIRAATTELLLLLDSNCIAAPNAIEKGLDFFKKNNPDFCAPNIKFTFSSNPDIYEILDSLYFIDIKRDIEQGGIPATAIFCGKMIFNKYEFFPEDMRSNGDTFWSNNIVKKGANLRFIENSYFYYPAKSKKTLLKKCYRVGKGNNSLWKKRGKTTLQIYVSAIWNMRPDSIKSIKRRIERRGLPELQVNLILLWVGRWKMKIYTGLGRIKFPYTS